MAAGQADVSRGEAAGLSDDGPAEIDFVMPVYNEGANIGRALEEIYANVLVPKRVLIVYDFDEDDTLPVARSLMPRYPGVELVRNTRGKGVLNAVRAGIAAARAEVVIVTMADLSDDLRVVPKMAAMIRNEGFDVVCASRYMKGGAQIGGPRFKSFLSRMAGVSLYWIAGLPTHDATNAFRAYRRSVLEETEIESHGGFEYSLEITAKAFARGRKIGEVPSVWRDRSAGESRFQLRRWLPQYLRWYHWTLDRSRRADFLALSFLLIVTLALGLGFILGRPDLSRNSEFALGEDGNQLFRVDRINQGGVLYRDVACQDGPIPVYLHAAVSRVAGNSIRTDLCWHLAWTLIAVAMAYRLLRRGAGVALSLGVAVVVCVPLLLAPGGVSGIRGGAEFKPVEKVCLLALLLLWKPCDSRSLGRCARLGAVLGIWQGVKFGGAFVGGASILVLDLLTLPPANRRQGLQKAIAGWIVLGSSFLAAESIWVIWAFATLPSWLAFETIWPAYIVPAYGTSLELIPRWESLRQFVTRLWMPLLCALAGLAALTAFVVRSLRRPATIRREDRAAAAPALGLIFFALGAAISFQHVHNLNRFLWVLAFPAAWGLSQIKPSLCLGLGLLALPALALTTKVDLLTRVPSTTVPYRMRTGEALHVNAEEQRELEMLDREFPPTGAGGPGFAVALFGWGGGGFYHFYEPDFPLRNFMMEPIALRPADEAALAAALPRVRAFILFRVSAHQAETPAETIRRTFSAPLAARILTEYRPSSRYSAGRLVGFTREISAR